jgi:hypothetical protein
VFYWTSLHHTLFSKHRTNVHHVEFHDTFQECGGGQKRHRRFGGQFQLGQEDVIGAGLHQLGHPISLERERIRQRERERERERERKKERERERERERVSTYIKSPHCDVPEQVAQ